MTYNTFPISNHYLIGSPCDPYFMFFIAIHIISTISRIYDTMKTCTYSDFHQILQRNFVHTKKSKFSKDKSEKKKILKTKKSREKFFRKTFFELCFGAKKFSSSKCNMLKKILSYIFPLRKYIRQNIKGFCDFMNINRLIYQYIKCLVLSIYETFDLSISQMFDLSIYQTFD